MPLHVDVKINDKLIDRIHISRMTKNGMKDDSINEYAVVKGEEKTFYNEETGLLNRGFTKEPGWLEWEESEIRFNHQYGEEATVCLLKALEAMHPEHTQKARADTLQEAYDALLSQVTALHVTVSEQQNRLRQAGYEI